MLVSLNVIEWHAPGLLLFAFYEQDARVGCFAYPYDWCQNLSDFAHTLLLLVFNGCVEQLTQVKHNRYFSMRKSGVTLLVARSRAKLSSSACCLLFNVCTCA